MLAFVFHFASFLVSTPMFRGRVHLPEKEATWGLAKTDETELPAARFVRVQSHRKPRRKKTTFGGLCCSCVLMCNLLCMALPGSDEKNLRDFNSRRCLHASTSALSGSCLARAAHHHRPRDRLAVCAEAWTAVPSPSTCPSRARGCTAHSAHATS